MTITDQITFYYTDKFEVTSNFYENILRLKLVLDQGDCKIFQTTKSAFIGFCKCVNPVKPKDVLFTLVTDNVDEWYEDLKDKDVTFIQKPKQNDQFGIYHCFLQDPNGYKIEIQSFNNKNWKL